MDPASRTALVTGASAGIGAAFAEVFAAHGFDLIVTARREDRLRSLASTLGEHYGRAVHVIVADLAETDAATRLCHDIRARGLAVDALVNNAGFGLSGAYTSKSWKQQSELLQVLVVAVAELTHCLLPGMIERRYGRIVNVASLAGLLPAPGGHTLYAASKAFLIRFSEALDHEVKPYGVHVTALCPGFTRSEFHDVSGTRETVQNLPAFMWMDAARVVGYGFDAVMAGDTICVPGPVNSALAALGRYLPYPFVYALMRRFSWSYRRL